MRRSESEIKDMLTDRGIGPGVYVSWQPSLKNANRRYACVMSLDGCADGTVEVLASNGRFRLPAVILKVEHDLPDAIVADQHATFGCPKTPCNCLG